MANTAKKQPNGKWRVVLRDGEKFKSFTANTKDEAEFLAAQYKVSKKTTTVNNKKMSAMFDRYIDNRTEILSPSTIALYRNYAKNSFTNIANKKIENVAQSDIQCCVNELSKDHKPHTVKNTIAFLRKVLKEYRPDFSFEVNIPRDDEQDIVIPESDQITKLFEEVKGTDMELPVLCAALMGLRRSEICGIDRDKDINGNILYIRRSVVYDEKHQPVVKTTKTSKSKRNLRIPKQIMDILPPEGEPFTKLSPAVISKRFKEICDRNGYKFTFHKLRHYYASVMLQLGVPDKYAEERMGHSTNQMLKRVYQHTFSSEHEKISDKIEQFFDEKIGSPK